MEFRLFGEVTAVEGEREVPLGHGRPAAVLSLLLLEPGRLHPVDRLVEELWGQAPSPGSAHAIRVYVSRLRASLSRAGLDESLVVSRAGGYLADLPASAVDLCRFRDLVRRARSTQEHGEALELSETALALWTAEPLSGFAYDDFAVREVERLREMRLDATEIWAGAALGLGRPSDVAAMLADLVEEHPYRERLWALLATARYQEERQTEALETLAAARSALAEAGLEPAPRLTALETAILRHDRSLAVRPAVEDNLPAPVDRFVGRDDEMAEIELRIQRSRLVTLTGPGGCGKTRLAVESARRLLARFGGRVWLVDLAPVSSAAAVAEAAADAVGLGRWSHDAPGVAIRELLGAQPALLVVDNCEHVIEPSAALVRELLQHCPGVRVLATTREPLRIPGEDVFVTPSLPVPDAQGPVDRSLTADAMTLFVDRTRRAAPGFVLTTEIIPHVAQIVRRLDGIPLAIELAAVRVRTLPVQELARRLDDVFGVLGVGSRTALPRHRTLEAAVSWSNDLLDDAEQELFRRLGVFRSSFGAEAAAAVSVEGSVETAEQLLAGLVEKSMVVAVSDDEPRYRLLEPIRQFSMRRLRDAGMVAEVEARRDDHYVAFAEDAVAGDRRHEDPRWQQRVRRERPNLEASIRSLLARGRGEEAAGMAAALTDYWRQLGWYEEGQRLIGTILASGVPITDRTRRHLTLGGVWLAVHQGRYAVAESLANDALALARAEDSAIDQAHVFNALGSLHAERGDMRRARRWLSRAIEITATDEPGAAVPPTINLAAVSAWAADTAGADQLLTEARRLSATGLPGRLDAMFALVAGVCARMSGDLASAVPLLDEAIAGLAERGPEFHLAYGQFERALVAFEGGDLDGATRRCHALMARSAVADAPLLPRIRTQLLAARLAAARGLVDRARADLLAALDEARETGTVGGIAEAADAAGHLLHATTDRRYAPRLCGWSSSLRRELALARDPWEERQLSEVMSQADTTGPDLPPFADPDDLAELVRSVISRLPSQEHAGGSA